MNYGKLAINVVLTLVILFLIYRLSDELFSPYFFEKSKEKKYVAVKAAMDEIVKAQDGYKSVKGRYTDNFDSLAYVLTNDSVAQIRSFGEEGDSVMVLSMSEAIALFEINPNQTEEKLIEAIVRNVTNYNRKLKEEGGESITTYKVEDTTYVPVLNTINLSISVDSLKYIPYSGGDLFQMNTDVLTMGLGRVQVPVYEVVAFNKSILKTNDPRFFDPEAGIRLGSLLDATTDIIEFKKGE